MSPKQSQPVPWASQNPSPTSHTPIGVGLVGLGRPRDDLDIPEAEAILQPPPRRGLCFTWLVLDCPHCHQQHTHGAGMDGTTSGHRVSHCSSNVTNPGYYLKRAGPTGGQADDVIADRALTPSTVRISLPPCGGSR
jgi:hypothetical protein